MQHTLHSAVRALACGLVALVAMATAYAAPPANPGAKTSTGYVYVMTNDPAANAVIQYARAADGSLTQIQEVPTGGLGGTGNGVGDLDPLGSADSLVLANDGSLLLAVNAGSNQLTSLSVDGDTVAVVGNVDSGGEFPSSVAVSGNIVYVLNAHTPNIVGFTLGGDGTLTPIDGAVFDVPGATDAKPHDIRFSPDGTSLVVTDEGLNQLDVFALDDTGLVTGVTSTPSAGTGPFGSKFGAGNVLVSTEAASGSASTYTLNNDGSLSVVSGQVENGQLATCWVSLTSNGMFAFVSNTASGTLSTYHVSPGDGTLDLANATSATLDGGGPIDSAISSDDAYLYVLDTVQGQVASFRITGAALHPLGTVTGLPLTVQGIVAQ